MLKNLEGMIGSEFNVKEVIERLENYVKNGENELIIEESGGYSVPDEYTVSITGEVSIEDFIECRMQHSLFFYYGQQ